jgi:hypothetical protein
LLAGEGQLTGFSALAPLADNAEYKQAALYKLYTTQIKILKTTTLSPYSQKIGKQCSQTCA